MAKAPGRLAVLSKAATPIGGVRVTTIKFSAEPIDVTDMDSAGVMEYLTVAKNQSIELTVEGIAEDVVLRAIWNTPATSKLLTDLTFKFSDALVAADTVGGNFFMTSYEEGNPYDDATTFKASFASSGTWTVS